MKRIVSIVASAVFVSAVPALAQQAGHDAHHAGAAASPQAADAYVTGEVKKIDKEAGKITLKHGPIENLGMPPMTMVFRAKDPASLDKVKVGDAVEFKADRIDGAMTVTDLRPAS